VNFPSIARFFAQPAVPALGASALVHGIGAGIIWYLLLALPQIWEINIRQGEAIFIQAQLGTVATAMPEPVAEVDVSVEPISLVPAPPVAVDHAPVRETFEAVPVAIPLAKHGEHEPADVPPLNKPPETPQQKVTDLKPARSEPIKDALPEQQNVAKSPPRQIADQPVIAESNVTVAAIAPAIVGAQVDEQPRLLPFNREPYYPLDALFARREGRVVLLVHITASGRATNISIATSSGTASLDASAIEAVRDWQFIPAKRQGIAVLHEALVPVNFSIRRS
jgi:protein TonB